MLPDVAIFGELRVAFQSRAERENACLVVCVSRLIAERGKPPDPSDGGNAEYDFQLRARTPVGGLETVQP
jgi:hypothetical protein